VITPKEQATSVALAWCEATGAITAVGTYFDQLVAHIEYALKVQNQETRRECAEATLTATNPFAACMAVNAYWSEPKLPTSVEVIQK
jgi:hypothetical protein